LIRAAGTRPIEELLAEERTAFDRSRLGAEAAALRHLFFASRAAGRAAVPRELVAASLRGACGAADAGSAHRFPSAHEPHLATELIAAAVRSAGDERRGLAGQVDLVAVEELGFPRHES